MKVGRRLAIKVLNAAKFVLGPPRRRAAAGPEAVTEALDRDLLASLGAVVADATAAFDAYDHTRALERTESVLLVVLRRLPRAGQDPRLRRGGRRRRADSARAALALALSVLPAPARAVPALRHGGGLAVVARGLGAPRALAARRRAAGGRERPRLGPRAGRARSSRRCAGPRAGQAPPSAPTSTRCVVAASPRASAALASAAGDLCAAGPIRELVVDARRASPSRSTLAP